MNVRVVGFDWQATKGIGLYPVPMAARLTGADARKIAGWINGYRGGAPAIIRRQLPLIGGRTVLGFLDLIEVRFIDHFRGLGLSAQLVTKVAEKPRRRQKTDHPFATNKRFRTDGRTIFLEESQDDNGETNSESG